MGNLLLDRNDVPTAKTEYDRASIPIFGRPFCISRRPWLACDGKSAKVLSMANCGMGAAVDIGVICDHVIGFHRYLWRGCDLRDVGEFALGRQPRNASATNLLKRSLIKSEVKGLVKLFFFDKLKSLKNKSENY